MLATVQPVPQADDDGPDEQAVCDYCHRLVDLYGPHTQVGSSVYHTQPSCYVRKLLAIHRPF